MYECPPLVLLELVVDLCQYGIDMVGQWGHTTQPEWTYLAKHDKAVILDKLVLVHCAGVARCVLLHDELRRELLARG